MSEPPTPPDGGQDSGKPQKKRRKAGRIKGDRISQVTYNRLVQSFRKAPGNYAEASRFSGVCAPTAKRGWVVGWPCYGWLPIKELLKEEHALARAHLYDTEQLAKERAAEIEARAHEMLQSAEERCAQRNAEAEQIYKEKLEKANHDIKQRLADTLDKAKMDAAETMAVEAQISRSSRGTAMALFAIGSNIFSHKNLPAIINLINNALSQAAAMSPREAANLLRAFGRFGIDANQTAKLALDIERERLGQPTEVIQMNVEGVSQVEALKEIDDAKILADLLREEQTEAEKNDESNGSIH